MMQHDFEAPGWYVNEEAAIAGVIGDSNWLEQTGYIVTEANPKLEYFKKQCWRFLWFVTSITFILEIPLQ